jgi:hypothetical protein
MNFTYDLPDRGFFFIPEARTGNASHTKVPRVSPPTTAIVSTFVLDWVALASEAET